MCIQGNRIGLACHDPRERVVECGSVTRRTFCKRCENQKQGEENVARTR